jgi:hypothetical protein
MGVGASCGTGGRLGCGPGRSSLVWAAATLCPPARRCQSGLPDREFLHGIGRRTSDLPVPPNTGRSADGDHAHPAGCPGAHAPDRGGLRPAARQARGGRAAGPRRRRRYPKQVRAMADDDGRHPRGRQGQGHGDHRGGLRAATRSTSSRPIAPACSTSWAAFTPSAAPRSTRTGPHRRTTAGPFARRATPSPQQN